MSTSHSVTVDEGQIRVLEAGRGPSVVLLHGGIIDAATVTWPPVIEALAEESHVVAPDLLGYGESDLPPGPYPIRRHTTVITDMLDELALEDVTLVGHSMGGGVALDVALTDPSRISSVVPIDAYGLGRQLPNGKLSYLLARVQVFNELSIGLLRRSRWLTRASLDGIVHDLDSLSPDAVDAVFEELQRPTAGAAFRRFRDAEVGSDGYRTTFQDRLPSLSVPASFLHGRHDSLFPVEWAQRAVKAVPEGSLTVLDQCAHWAPREDPDAVASAIRDAVSGRE